MPARFTRQTTNQLVRQDRLPAIDAERHSHILERGREMTMPDRAAVHRAARGNQRNQPTESLPMLLDGSGVAQHLGITERHVRRLVSERRIPFVKVGRFVRFDTIAVASWLERTAVKASR